MNNKLSVGFAGKQLANRSKTTTLWRGVRKFSAALLLATSSATALADIACEGMGTKHDWGVVERMHPTGLPPEHHSLNSSYDEGVFSFGNWNSADRPEWQYPTTYRGKVGPRGIPVWDMTVPNNTTVNLGDLTNFGNGYVQFPGQQPFPMTGMKFGCRLADRGWWHLFPYYETFDRIIDDPAHFLDYRHPNYPKRLGSSKWITSSDSLPGKPGSEKVDGVFELINPVVPFTSDKNSQWASNFIAQTGGPLQPGADSHYVHMWAYFGNRDTGHKTMAVLGVHIADEWPKITLTDPGEKMIALGDSIPDSFYQATAIDFDGQPVPVTAERIPLDGGFHYINYTAVSKHGQSTTIKRKVSICQDIPKPAAPITLNGNQAIPLFQYNARGDHVYTTNWDELGGCGFEKVAGYVHATQVSDSSHFLRFYGNGDHFYTTNRALAKRIVTENFNSIDWESTKRNYRGYGQEGDEGWLYNNQVPGTLPLLQLHNPQRPDHFYTADQAEADRMIATEGYQLDRVIGYIGTGQEPAPAPVTQNCVDMAAPAGPASFNGQQALPLFRYLLSDGNHKYTLNWDESRGCGFQEITGYAFSAQQPGTVPLHRLLKSSAPANYFYTTDDGESAAVDRSADYNYEWIEGYIYSTVQPGTVPVYRMFHPRPDHLLTVNPAERDDLMRKGYGNDGVKGHMIRIDAVKPPTIKASHSGKCLDVVAASQDNRANIQQWDCHGGPNQNWELVPDGNHYQIKAGHSGKCMEVTEARLENRANVYQFDCNGPNNQKWELVPDGNLYQIKAGHSGKCLEVMEARHDNGTTVQQFDCNGLPNQKWMVE